MLFISETTMYHYGHSCALNT